MTAFNGRWKMVDHSSNLEAYHNQIKTPDAYKEKLRTIIKASMTDPEAYVEDLKVDQANKTVSRTVYINGEKTREVLIAIGSEKEITGADGRTYKGTLNFEGNTKLRFHQKGSDFEAEQVFELKGDVLELTLTSGSVVATQTYNRG